MVDHRDHLAEHFTPGEELVVYRDIPQLHQLLRHHLDHPDETSAMARQAMHRAHTEHTYRHRAAQMLAELGL
jgi:spore maturation protein CgeB